MSQIQTHNGGDYVKTRQKDISATGFNVKMEEDIGDKGHAKESIGWLAITTSRGHLSGLKYSASVWGGVTHSQRSVRLSYGWSTRPLIFGSIASFAGSDPCELRLPSLVQEKIGKKTYTTANIFVEEDTCVDSERNHRRTDARPSGTHDGLLDGCPQNGWWQCARDLEQGPLPKERKR